MRREQEKKAREQEKKDYQERQRQKEEGLPINNDENAWLYPDRPPAPLFPAGW